MLPQARRRHRARFSNGFPPQGQGEMPARLESIWRAIEMTDMQAATPLGSAACENEAIQVHYISSQLADWSFGGLSWHSPLVNNIK